MHKICCTSPSRNFSPVTDNHEIEFQSNEQKCVDSISLPVKILKHLNDSYNIHFGSSLKINSDSQTISYKENEILNERYVKIERIYRVIPVHFSIANGHKFSYRILTKEDSGEFASIIFICSGQKERDNKIRELLEYIVDSDSYCTEDTNLKISVKEARNLSFKKRYYCDIKLDEILYARTSVKENRDTLFWGEEFNLKGLPKVKIISVVIWKLPRNNEKIKLPQVVCQVNIRPGDLDAHCFTDKWYSPSPIIGLSLSNSGMNSPSGNGDGSISDQLKYSVACNLDSAPDTVVMGNHQDRSQVRDTAPLLRLSSRLVPLVILNRCNPLYISLVLMLQSHGVALLLELDPCITAKYREQLVEPIVCIATQQRWLPSFLGELIAKETKNSDINLILRGNSMGSKAIECFLKLECQYYLHEMLSETIHEIQMNYSDLEIDRTRLRKLNKSTKVSAVAKRLRSLESVVANVLNRIFTSIDKLPRLVRLVFQELRCRLIAHGITDKEFLNKVISACLFLRLICPAIMTPYLFNLVSEYSQKQELHRAFTLVAKCVQKVANFASIEEQKEGYMKDMVFYCRDFYNDMQSYLTEISTNDSTFDYNDLSHEYDQSYNRTASYYKDNLAYETARLSYHMNYIFKQIKIKQPSNLMNQVTSILMDIHNHHSQPDESSLDTIDQLKHDQSRQMQLHHINPSHQRNLELSTKSSGYFSTFNFDSCSNHLNYDELYLAPDNQYNLDKFKSLIRAQESKSGSLTHILELEQQKLDLIKTQSQKIDLFQNINQDEFLDVSQDLDQVTIDLTDLDEILSSRDKFYKYLNYANGLVDSCLQQNQNSDNCQLSAINHDQLEQIMKINPTIQMALLKMMDS